MRKIWLDKCLKSPVSEDPSTRNMVNELKHCWNLNGSTFTIIFDHCEGNSVRKSLSKLYAKSQYNLLTHWLLMTSILFLIETIHCNYLRLNYLLNKKHFLNLFVRFWNWDSILNIFGKRMTFWADVLLNWGTPKKVIRSMSKKFHLTEPFHK